MDEADHGKLASSVFGDHWSTQFVFVVLVVVDGYAATKGADKETYEQILDRLKEKRIPTTLVMNKVSRRCEG